MGKREYYTSDHRIPTQKELYFPTFLAANCEELGVDQAARRALKEYSIMFPAKLEVEEEPAPKVRLEQTRKGDGKAEGRLAENN